MSRDLSTAYVALGSNRGDRDEHLAFAVRALDELPNTRVVECSPVYETEPVGPGEQGPYLNAVVSLETSLPPRRLLEGMLAMEVRAGRDRSAEIQRWGPRALDLDLLLFDDDELDEPDFVVPHPRLAERSFVLAPLADLAPDLVHPQRGSSVAELLVRLSPETSAGGLPAGVRLWERCLRIGR